MTKSSPAAGGVLCCSDSVSGSPTATPTPSVAALFVANSAANSVTAYPLNGTGDQTPANSISGSNTGLGKPQGVAVDSGGSIYVSNSGNNSITVYSNSASGNVSPTKTIAGVSTGLNSPEGIALDSSGNIYVANPSGNSVAKFSSGSIGNASPITTISGGSTGLNNPQGVAVDSAGNIYVSSYGSANGGSDTVTMYAPGSSGNASPSATIGGASTGLAGPLSIAVDSSGNIYVVNFVASQIESVTIYAPGTTGNMSPSATISGNATRLENPAGIAVDAGGNLYVTNDGSANGDADTVTKYAEGQSGNLAPYGTLVGADVMLGKPAGIAIGPFLASTPAVTATPTATATATPTATGTATATQTATLTATATATPTTTGTATPTATKTSTRTPTATATSTSTATSTRTATPTATATKTATPTASATSTATTTKTPKPTKTPRPRKTPKPTPTATPVPAYLEVNKLSYDFGKVKVGQRKSVTFTLTNSAQEGPPITFASPAGFMVPVTTPQVFGFAGSATDCPRRLFPKNKCKLKVEFIPAKSGFRSSMVTISDNAANANQTIQLSGSGK